MKDASAVTVVPRKRRGIELVLIIFALIITLGAFALVDINVTGSLSDAFPYVAGFSVRDGGPGPHLRPLATAVRRSGHPALRDRVERAWGWR